MRGKITGNGTYNSGREKRKKILNHTKKIAIESTGRDGQRRPTFDQGGGNQRGKKIQREIEKGGRLRSLCTSNGFEEEEIMAKCVRQIEGKLEKLKYGDWTTRV